MSNYFQSNRGALGAGYDPFNGGQPSDFGWVLNLPKGNRVPNSQYGCGNKRTGQPYTGGVTTFPCSGKPPASSGGSAVYDFLKDKLLPSTGPSYQGGPGGMPSVTGSSLLVPAVAVVGVVGLLLILKKKK